MVVAAPCSPDISLFCGINILNNIPNTDRENNEYTSNFLFENILLTNPGEKLSDPNFGVGLRSFLFEPQNSFYDLQNVIGEQLGQYAQGIQILNVAVDLSGVDANSVAISIKYLNPKIHIISITGFLLIKSLIIIVIYTYAT